MSTLRQRTWVVLCAVISLLAALGWALYASSSQPTTDAAIPTAVDIGFCQAMSSHHQQAVQLAQIVLRGTGASAQIRSLADTFQITQAREIGWMAGFLDLWHAPSQPDGDPMSWMGGHDMAATGAGMPGMASQDELNQLAGLSGTALDIRFLQLMLRHHLGGIVMAAYAVDHAGVPQAQALANRIVLDQSQEVTLLQRLLRGYRAAPLPFPASQALGNSGVMLGHTP
jgi:uncharacterized protein (DUF305 family)